MIKNFVFDTNVLLTDPRAILKFQDNNVVIPITVLEEVDKFKRDLTTVGRNAREAARMIDRFRSKGNLQKGIPLDNGGTLRIMTDLGKEPPLPFPTLGKTADSLILACALLLRKREDLPVVFVTRDINLRIRADAVGLDAVTYEEDTVVVADEMYTGTATVTVSHKTVDAFVRTGKTPGKNYDLHPNEAVTLVSETDEDHFALGRYHAQTGSILRLIGENEDNYGITARNAEQSQAFDLLLDDDVHLVTLSGKAGTGKTLLAIAAGMRKTLDDGAYDKLVVARPIMPLGKELGFLPGDMGEKLKPWMEPVFDNLDLILKMRKKAQSGEGRKKKGGDPKAGKGDKGTGRESIKDLLASGLMEVQPLTYIRGRSLPRQYMIIDEAQNLTHHEVKTIITRAGEGTKVVLTGDPYQIDNPFLEATTSGLNVVIERFKDEETIGHITLVKGERSGLAELATNLL